MLPAAWIGLTNLRDSEIDPIAKWFAGFALFLLFLQFLPFSSGSSMPAYDGKIGSIEFWTISPSRSLQSALFAFVIVGFSSFVADFPQDAQYRLLPFLVLGFVINLATGIIQLSYSGRLGTESILPFTILLGLFANKNHFATLVYMVIPIFAWRFLYYSRNPVAYAAIATGIVAFLFAVDSRAGMAISILLALFSGFWFAAPSVPARTKLVGAIAIGVLVLLALMAMAKDLSEADFERLTFFSNTWRAIMANGLTGTGLGTFVIVYPTFEPPGDVIPTFVNHAHNDWLELMLETGIPAFIALVVLFLTVLWRGVARSPLHEAAVLSIGAILLHGVVDYPLRTMGIGVPFASFCAIVCSTREPFLEYSKDRKGGVWRKLLAPANRAIGSPSRKYHHKKR
jgi:O-antigen ligase